MPGGIQTDLSPLLRIDTTKRTSATSKSGTTSRGSASAEFMPVSGEATTRAAQSAPLAATAGIEAILALQAAGGPLEGRKKAVRRGQTLLDTLEEMKADLLLGRVSPDRLDALMSTLGAYRERSLPQLDAVLDKIELRVRVELAKFGRFPPI